MNQIVDESQIRDRVALKLLLTDKTELDQNEIDYFRQHPDEIDEITAPVNVHKFFLWIGSLLGIGLVIISKLIEVQSVFLLKYIHVKEMRYILFALLLLLGSPLFISASEENKSNQLANPTKESLSVAVIPDLADIVPLQIKLQNHLKILEKRLQVGLDAESLDKSYLELESDLAGLVDRVENLKELQEYKYNKLVELREILKQKSDAFELMNTPLSLLIRELGSLRKEWQEESTRWSQWQDYLLKEGELEQLKSTFDQATVTINTALDLVLSKMDTLFAMQERAGVIEQKLGSLISEVEEQVSVERRNTLFNDTPLMFSKQYLAQLKNVNLWDQVFLEINELTISEKNANDEHGWIAVFQLLLVVILIFSISKRKKFFQESERWRFLALYPIASGLFLSYICCVLIYEYNGAPQSWKLVVTIIGATSFARLMKGVVDENWKSIFINGLITIVVVTRFMDILSLPIPVFRLYVFFAASAGIIFCLRLLRVLKEDDISVFIRVLLRSGVLFFTLIVFFEIWGRKSLASYLFVSMIRSIGTVLIFSFFMYMIRGGLEWLFSTPLLKLSTPLKENETDKFVTMLARFFDILIVLLVIVPGILMIWGVFQSMKDATNSVLSFGYNFGSNHISIGLLIISSTILYSSFLISWVVQKLLIDQLLFKRSVGVGARISIARLMHYFIIVVGFLLAISALGIEITKLTIMVSALGVGIGFGLQGIVNNFVCGLVLLFEQPIRVGDMIELEGKWARIMKIGLRATTVQTLDQADIIVPNADLVSNQVTNWTLSNRQARLMIAVGVAYGSDVPLVMETLRDSAKNHKDVANYPAPQVLFLDFGESTLSFELRVWVKDAENRLSVGSDVRQEIDRRFREKNIEIAFPQLDLHLRNTPFSKSTVDSEKPQTAI